MNAHTRMKKRLLSTALLVFVVLFIILAYGYQKSANIHLRRVDTSLVLPNSEYMIDPIQYDPNVREEERVFPFVRMKPDSMLYWIIRRDEEDTMKKGSLPPSFYASKRVSELERWRTEYNVDESYSGIEQLRSMARTSIMTWENLFARYYDLYLRELQMVTTETDEYQLVSHISKLQRLLNLDQNRIYGSIINSGRGESEQKYLKSISDDVFEDLERRLSNLGPKTSDTILLYSLDELQKNHDLGLYDVILDTANLPPGIKFSLDGVDIEATTYDFVHQNQQQQRAGSLLVLPVSESAHALQLHLNPVPLAQESSWIPEEVQNKTYRYTVQLATPSAELSYVVQATYNMRVPINIQLTRTEPGKTSILIDENFYPHSYQKQFEQRLVLRNRADVGTYKLVINSSEQLSARDLDGLTVSVSRLLLPQIILNKRAYLSGREPKVSYEKINEHAYRITVTDGTNVVDGYVEQSLGTVWGVTKKETLDANRYALIVENTLRLLIIKLMIGTGLAFLIVISFLLIWIHNDHAAVVNTTSYLYRHYMALSHISRKMARTYAWASRGIMKKMIRVGSMLAYLLIVVLLILLAGAFSFLQGYPEHAIVAAGVVWMLISIGFLVNRRTAFALMLLCFVLSAYTYVSDNTATAITAAGWGIMFLLCGLIYTYAYRWIVTLHIGINRPGTSVITAVETVVKHTFLAVYKQIRKIVSAFFDKLIIKEPKRKRHHVWNMSVVIATIAAVIYICYLLFSAGLAGYQIYKDTQHQRLRESLNPIITKVEPSIVYHSTKVVIYGSGFGWQQEGTRALKKDGEIVDVDLWTDTKIILTVPLHWKTGTITLWTEKPLLWDGKTVTAKSNTVKIKLIPTTNTFTPDDDAYFQQLKTLSPETLKMNGYQQ